MIIYLHIHSDSGDAAIDFVDNKDLEFKALQLKANTYASNFESWSQAQVTNWIKKTLTDNEFRQNTINSFVAAFDEKCINGKVLLKMKQKPEFIDSLSAQFEKQHQLLGIWLVIKSAIADLPIDNAQKYSD